MLSYTTLQTIIQLFRMIFDILILWVLLYYTIKIVRNNSRTAQIFKGIILILIIRAIANFFGFKAVDWLAGVLVTYGFLAIIIIFQPEIRSILERLGKNTLFSRISTLSGNERERLVEELVNATMNLSSNRVGALITLEQGHSLSDFIKTGTPMNSLVTADLLTTIFLPNTPIHDGAVIIQGDRIACASAYFPPTNMIVPTRFGARHRAAIGISEITDSVTIVVSEKSGRVSIAEEGKLIPVNQTELKAYLQKTILHGEEELVQESPKTIIPVAPEAVSPEIVQEESITNEKRSMFKRLFSPNPSLTQNAKPVEEKVVKEKPAPQEEPQDIVQEEVPQAVQAEPEITVEPVFEPEVIQEPEVIVEPETTVQPEPENLNEPVQEVTVESEPEKIEELPISQESEVVVKKSRKKTVEMPVEEPKPVKKGFFASLFGSKVKESKVEVFEVKSEPEVNEEPKPKPKRKPAVKKTAASTSSEKKTTPKKASTKKTPKESKSDDVVKIKETPHVKLEFSVSDESLLDDSFDSNSNEGGNQQ